jgi:hypothetical protein
MRAAVLVSCSRAAMASSTAANSWRASSRIGGRESRSARYFSRPLAASLPRAPGSASLVSAAAIRSASLSRRSWLVVGALPRGGSAQLALASPQLLDRQPVQAGDVVSGPLSAIAHGGFAQMGKLAPVGELSRGDLGPIPAHLRGGIDQGLREVATYSSCLSIEASAAR